MTSETTDQRDQTLAAIASETLGVPTLATRNSDRLDFHAVSVWGLQKALRLAWARGYETAAGPNRAPSARIPGGTRVLNTRVGEVGIVRNGFTYDPERGWVEYEVETKDGVERWERDAFLIFGEAAARGDDATQAAPEPSPRNSTATGTVHLANAFGRRGWEVANVPSAWSIEVHTPDGRLWAIDANSAGGFQLFEIDATGERAPEEHTANDDDTWNASDLIDYLAAVGQAR